MKIQIESDLIPAAKIDLSTVYGEPDPRRYFEAHGQLRYVLPWEAKPHLERVVKRIRADSRG